MKTLIETRSKVNAAILLIALVSVVSSTAQTFTTLKSFGTLTNITGLHPRSRLVQGPDGTLYGTTAGGQGSVAGTVFKVQPDGSSFTVLKWFTNSFEGASPVVGLTLSDSVLYGTTEVGGSSGAGTVFKVNTDGTGYTVLKHFTYAGSDGVNPNGGLALSGSVLYGTTSSGGSSGGGTVFQVNTDGTGYTVLKHFTGSDEVNPNGGLALSGSVLYGTTSSGGSSGRGTVFQVNTDGTGYTVLKHFTGSDGVNPNGGLALSGSVLYGTTSSGGSSGAGTVFKVNTDGTGYTVLKHFPGWPASDAYPNAGLTLSGSVLYGTTSGVKFGGSVFKLNTDGTGYTVLEGFTGWPGGGLTLSGSVLYGTTEGYYGEIDGTAFRMNTDGTDYAVLRYFPARLVGDGVNPRAGLTLSGSVLYGTTERGGSDDHGTVFQVNTDGTGYAVLKNFTNSDGAFPNAGLTLSGGVLYGTTTSGGSSNAGTVFKLNTDATGYTVLKHFTGLSDDGAYPKAGLTLSGGVLYGTTTSGGSSGWGTLFRVNTDGTGYTVLKHFTRSDGWYPVADLTLSGGVLYGTTAYYGESSDSGTVFRVNTDGTGYTVLKYFNYAGGAGVNPHGGLTLSDGVLYGTTHSGGSSIAGTVFKVETNGAGYTVLKNFTDSDGRWPSGGLTLSGSALYGTTESGGSSYGGTVFKVNTDGTGYTVLKHFTMSVGTGPAGSLSLSGGALYGTTTDGGSLGLGSVFRLGLSESISLTGQSPGSTLILSWNNPGFVLQAAPEVTGTYTNIPGATSPYTNAISGPQRFFRLVRSW